MENKKTIKFRKWEIALLSALCITLLSGVWARAEQDKLASGLIRLHVVASSDSQADQAVKLLVRDAVLEMVTPALEGVTSRAEAEEIVNALLPEIEEKAREVTGREGLNRDAVASLGIEYYPTRVYGNFSLPAGNYLSLRVILGEGEGKNWWCVVFPPLCAAAAEGYIESSALDEEDIGLITGENEGYMIKFRLLELWGELFSPKG